MKDRIVRIISNNKIAEATYKMVLACEPFEEQLRGGQFIHIALPDLTHPLRRPFCIADFDNENNTITIIYAILGEGTQILANLAEGINLKALYPLGNGFNLKPKDKKIVLLGGGLGSAVLPAIITRWPDKTFYTFLGFANKNRVVLQKEMESKGSVVYLATDDGSCGYKGFVTELLAQKLDEIKPDIILCCGPEVMYKSLLKTVNSNITPIFVSLEKRMGCGVGACLVCNCKIRTPKGDKFLRACVEGPVFNINEVVL